MPHPFAWRLHFIAAHITTSAPVLFLESHDRLAASLTNKVNTVRKVQKMDAMDALVH